MFTLLLSSFFAASSAPLPPQGQDFGDERLLTESIPFVEFCFVGDLDGDGDLDHVSGSETFLAWFENLGPAGFRRAQILPLGAEGSNTTLRSLTGGDLDGDGDLDLAATTEGQASVVRFENLGGGVFDEVQVVSTDLLTSDSVVADDLDSDGDLDLLVIDSVARTVVWFNYFGNGFYGPAWTIATTNDFPRQLVVDDFDQDGDRDVAISGSDELVLVENLGGLLFAPPVTLDDDTSFTESLTLADLDGDGRSDLAYVSRYGDYIASFQNLGASFGPKQFLVESIESPRTMIAGDFDGDNAVDLIVSNSAGVDFGLRFFANDGSAGLEDPILIDVESGGAEQLVDVDMDGDGTLDFVAATAKQHATLLYRNTGGALFEEGEPLHRLFLSPQQAQPVDIDGDGDLDILALSSLTDELFWFEGQGQGAYEFADVLLEAPGTIRHFDVLDADLDGDLDLVLAGSFGLNLYLGQGSGGFGAPAELAAGQVGFEVAVGDINGDGWTDLVYAAGASTAATWLGVLYNISGGAFSPPELVTLQNAQNILVANVSGASLPDIVFATPGLFGVFVINNNGQSPLPPPFNLPYLILSGEAEAADVDNDGDEDLLVRDLSKVMWFENLEGALQAPVTLAGGSHPAATIADLDGDDIADFLFGVSGTLYWSRGQGDGTFGLFDIFESDFTGVDSLTLGDLNGDGGSDFIAIGAGNRLSWYSNLMEADCNANGTFDSQEILLGLVEDCNGNGVPDSCDLLQEGADLDGDGQLDACVPPALSPSRIEASLAGGGAQRLVLESDLGSQLYLILSSASGSSPGTPIGGLTVPLNLDDITLWSIASANVAPYTESLGFLDPMGFADAVFTVPAGESPDLIGLELHHAYVTFDALGNLSSTSNAVPLLLLP